MVWSAGRLYILLLLYFLVCPRQRYITCWKLGCSLKIQLDIRLMHPLNFTQGPVLMGFFIPFTFVSSSFPIAAICLKLKANLLCIVCLFETRSISVRLPLMTGCRRNLQFSFPKPPLPTKNKNRSNGTGCDLSLATAVCCCYDLAYAVYTGLLYSTACLHVLLARDRNFVSQYYRHGRPFTL